MATSESSSSNSHYLVCGIGARQQLAVSPSLPVIPSICQIKKEKKERHENNGENFLRIFLRVIRRQRRCCHRLRLQKRNEKRRNSPFAGPSLVTIRLQTERDVSQEAAAASYFTTPRKQNREAVRYGDPIRCVLPISPPRDPTSASFPNRFSVT